MASKWFQAAWRKNTIVSGTLAVVIWSTICYMCIMGMEIPVLLSGAGGLTMAFFLKSKIENGG